MPAEDFARIMVPKSDEELLQVIEVDNKDYCESAVEAAKQELIARGIPFKEGSRAYVPSSFAEKYYDSENRFGDFLIDGLCYSILGSAVVFLVSAKPYSATWLLTTFATTFLYYFLLEACWGKTIGKWILGLKVVDVDGNKPTRGAIALRTLCRFIPFEEFTFLFGYGWTKTGKLKGNLHDQLSGTYVVSEKKIDRDRQSA